MADTAVLHPRTGRFVDLAFVLMSSIAASFTPPIFAGFGRCAAACPDRRGPGVFVYMHRYTIEPALSCPTCPPAGRQARSGTPARSAFTLIELLMVLSIMAILSLISLSAVPAVTDSLRKGAINQAADRIVQVAEAARELSRRSPAPTGDLSTVPHYGIAIVVDGPRSYACLTLGTTINDELIVNGKPQLRVDLGTSAQVFSALDNAAAAPMSDRLGWFYQYGSGRSIASPAEQKAIAIGTRAIAPFNGMLGDSVQLSNYGQGMVEYWGFNPPLPAEPASPVASALELRSLEGRHAVALAFYPVGPSSTLAIP